MTANDSIQLPDALEGNIGGDLLATYWPAGIAVAVGGGLVALYVVHRRRARRDGTLSQRRAVLLLVTAAVAVICAAALAVNAWVGYFPSVVAVQRWLSSAGAAAPLPDGPVATDAAPQPGSARPNTTADTGVAYQTTIPAVGRGMPDAAAWVYLPPGYDEAGSEQRYPSIVALHGAPGTSADWFTAGRLDKVLDVLIRDKSIPPVVVVAPDLNAGLPPSTREPINIPDGPRIEDFVVADVVAWADVNLRTIPDPGHRAVAGMSAGGFGALMSGLNHPEVFGGVISIMPYTRPEAEVITADAEALRRNSPLPVISERPSVTGQQFFLGQGDGESTAEATQILEALQKKDQPSTLRVFPGLGHNWDAARTIMPYGLVWMAKQLGWSAD